MLADEGLLCKCHKPVTRHRSRAQHSYGAFYYKCYKGSTPGSCKFFEWEQLPSPPPSPVMSPTWRDGNQEPTTPPRRRVVSHLTGDPAVDSPRRKAAIMAGLGFDGPEGGGDDEEGKYPSASTTPMVTPKKRPTASTSALKRPAFSDSPTKSSNFSQSGERALVRASTEGDLGSPLGREELLRLLEIKERQLEASEDTVRALQRQLDAARAEKDFFGPDSPVSLNASPIKGKGKALDFSSPPRAHQPVVAVPEPTSESSTIVHSHFSVRSPAEIPSGGRQVMWN